MSIANIKKEISHLNNEELVNLCLRLAKFKKENKELLEYLLFQSIDEAAYIQSLKEKLEEEFENLNQSNVYFIKKGIRRILRILKKQIRFSGRKETEIELLLYFCKLILAKNILNQNSKVIANMYHAQLAIIKTNISGLHEDAQYDYLEELKEIEKK